MTGLTTWANVGDYLSAGQTPAQAIQSAIDYMATNYGGGIAFVPPGTYANVSGIIMKNGVQLVGSGRATTILTCSTDAGMIVFDGTTNYAAMRDIFVAGYQNPSATQNVVSIANNVVVDIDRVNIFGGHAALFHQGNDGHINDSFIAGSNFACLVTNGANRYKAVKFDEAGPSNNPRYAVYIGTPGPQDSIMENYFTDCDMSGNYAGGSFVIDDSGANAAFAYVKDTPMSGAIGLNNFNFAKFDGVCFGYPSLSTVKPSRTVLVGCVALSPLSVPGAVKIGCVNII